MHFGPSFERERGRARCPLTIKVDLDEKPEGEEEWRDLYDRLRKEEKERSSSERREIEVSILIGLAEEHGLRRTRVAQGRAS